LKFFGARHFVTHASRENVSFRDPIESVFASPDAFSLGLNAPFYHSFCSGTMLPRLSLLLITLLVPLSTCWVSSPTSQAGRQIELTRRQAIAVPASQLDADLTADERTVVSVVRACGPSVAYVTSVLPLELDRQEQEQQERTRPWRQRSNGNNNRTSESNRLPRGPSLGSGSAFVVDENGYLVTNYHVIEGAYKMISEVESYRSMVDSLIVNATDCTRLSLEFWSSTLLSLLQGPGEILPKIYVRINSDTRYQQCRVVDVKPDLDVAVLKILQEDESNSTTTSLPPVRFGKSADLLVGQSLVAIGNPFGLDSSVTTGVVSALGRQLNTDGGRRRTRITPIRGCIQTDAAINPGT
jgi:S1-C subfamily serine protease